MNEREEESKTVSLFNQLGMSGDDEKLLVSRVDGSIRPYTEIVAMWDDMFTSTWMKLELPTT